MANRLTALCIVISYCRYGQMRLSTDEKQSDSFVFCNLLLEVRTDEIVH